MAVHPDSDPTWWSVSALLDDGQVVDVDVHPNTFITDAHEAVAGACAEVAPGRHIAEVRLKPPREVATPHKEDT